MDALRCSLLHGYGPPKPENRYGRHGVVGLHRTGLRSGHADQDRVLGLGSARLVDLLVATCLLWLLARIPAWAARMVFAGRPGSVVSVARSYVAYRLLRRGLARLTP